MGYRGKFITEHTAIELPIDFVNKYSEDYYIAEHNGTHYLNISSKFEKKGHFEILGDIKDFIKQKPFLIGIGYSIWAAIIWEDGRITRFDLSRNYQDEMLPVDDDDDMQNKGSDAAIARDVIDGLNDRIERMADGL